jgi:hypothetical protein
LAPGSSSAQHGGSVWFGVVNVADLSRKVYSLLLLKVFKNHSPFRHQLSAGPKGG